MERKISFADLQKAVDEAYENFKSEKAGTVDPRLTEVKPDTFGISVMLTDGRSVNKADADTLFPLTQVAKVPLSVVLLTQNSPSELVKKSGKCACKGARKEKPQVPFSPHGIRAVSAVVPQGDPEGKYGVILNSLLALTSGEPVLNDKLFQTLKAQAVSDDVVNKLAQADYTLYDDAQLSVDTYLKLMSLQLSAKQLATLGATIAADGRNPLTGEYAFDGSIAASVVALMAESGHCKRSIMMRTGLPGKGGFSGAYLAVLPGFGAIAVYSPEVDEFGKSVKGLQTIEYIANKLGLNVFASARVEVEK